MFNNGDITVKKWVIVMKDRSEYYLSNAQYEIYKKAVERAVKEVFFKDFSIRPEAVAHTYSILEKQEIDRKNQLRLGPRQISEEDITKGRKILADKFKKLFGKELKNARK